MSIVVDISNLLINLALGSVLLVLYISARYDRDKVQAWQIHTGASLVAAASFFWARVASADFYKCVPEGDRPAAATIDSGIRVGLVLLFLIPSAFHGPHPETKALSKQLSQAGHRGGQDSISAALGLLAAQTPRIWYSIYVSWIAIVGATWLTVTGGQAAYGRGATYDRGEFALMNVLTYLALWVTCITCAEALSYGKRVSMLRCAQAPQHEKNDVEPKPHKDEAAPVEVGSTSEGPLEVREASNGLEGIVIDNAQGRRVDEFGVEGLGSLMVQSMWAYPY